jgi:hypothetical protein
MGLGNWVAYRARVFTPRYSSCKCLVRGRRSREYQQFYYHVRHRDAAFTAMNVMVEGKDMSTNQGWDAWARQAQTTCTNNT